MISYDGQAVTGKTEAELLLHGIVPMPQVPIESPIPQNLIHEDL